jgi:hypothetical protein
MVGGFNGSSQRCRQMALAAHDIWWLVVARRRALAGAGPWWFSQLLFTPHSDRKVACGCGLTAPL